MKKNTVMKISIILGIMCFFLTCGIAIQLKTVENSSSALGSNQTENELRDSVLRWKEKYENAYKKLNDKEEELESLREKASSLDSSSTDNSAKLSKYNLLLGKSDMVGQGIIITLKDGDTSLAKTSSMDVIVHDGDLLEVVNALKNAGAEAISINGQRIVNTTAISCVGNVITINDEKVGAPFVIKAIGLTSQLYGAITIPGGYIEMLENDGVQVKIEQVEKSTIVIPKFEGIYKFEYATNVEE